MYTAPALNDERKRPPGMNVHEDHMQQRAALDAHVLWSRSVLHNRFAASSPHGPSLVARAACFQEHGLADRMETANVAFIKNFVGGWGPSLVTARSFRLGSR